MNKQFGGKVTGKVKQQLEQSPNWKKKSFENLEETKMEIKPWNIPSLMYQQLFKTKGRSPSSAIPIIAFDKESFLEKSDTIKFIWFGHSVVLLNVEGKIILIDPMMGPNASPIAPFKTKRFSENTLEILDDLPEIDVMLLTHDHYDHLDLASIKKLKLKVKSYWIALGSKRHFEEWGVSEKKIVEFDWWDTRKLNGINITFTPTRHFAGRGLKDRNKTLWGGWAIKSSTENIYFSGDGGYGKHFEEIGEKLGPFNFGFMECGQYNKLWHQIHMYPGESVQAAKDAQVNKIMPVHWAGFALSLHHWKTPVIDFIKHAQKESSEFIVPELGQIVSLNNSITQKAWWEELR